MSRIGIGEVIAKYRKAASITQEELGRTVGVSTQAVSRWECGGTPDVELLPAIADKLNISIDTLFGRDGTDALDLNKLLYNAIRQIPEEQRMNSICHFVWTMQKAACSTDFLDKGTLDDMLSAVQAVDRSTEANPKKVPWQIILANNYGSMLYGLAQDMPFALVLPEGPKGYAAMLKEPKEYLKLFTLLSKPHYLDMLIDVYSRNPDEKFTDRSAASHLKISQKEAREILDDLSIHNMIRHMAVADEEGMLRVYGLERNTELAVFLFFCGQMMVSTKEPSLQVSIREKPCLNAKPGTGSLVPKWNTWKSLEDKYRKYDLDLT